MLPVVAGTKEAKLRGLLEPRRLRPAWLHSQTLSKKKRKKKKSQKDTL
jgi:hypothetical protein